MISVQTLNTTQEGGGVRRGESAYFFELGLEAEAGGIRPQIPVFWKPNPFPHILMKEFYTCSIAGVPLEKGNLSALKRVVQESVAQLLKGEGIPSYYFLLRSSDEPIRVFRDRGQLNARPAEGPRFSAIDIHTLWERVSQYLVMMGRIAEASGLSTRLLSWYDLQLYPLVASLRTDDASVWWPIFGEPDASGSRLYWEPSELLAGWSQPAGSGELWKLRSELADRLLREEQLARSDELWIGNLPRGLWRALRSEGDRSSSIITFFDQALRTPTQVELPVHRFGQEWVTAVRDSDSAVSVHAANTAERLHERVAVHLTRTQRVPGVDMVLLTTTSGVPAAHYQTGLVTPVG